MCLKPKQAYGHLNDQGILEGQLSFRGKTSYYNFPVKVCCRKCILCQAQRRCELSTLMRMEAKTCKESSFLTLTYNNKSLPYYGGLNYYDLATFFESLKKHMKREGHPGFGYVFSGELGLLKERPHYHAVLFGLNLDQLQYGIKQVGNSNYHMSKMVDRIWKKGFNTVCKCTDATCAYTVGYTMKKLVKVDNNYLEKVSIDTAIRRNFNEDYITAISPNSKKALRYMLLNSPEKLKKRNKIAEMQKVDVIDGRKFPVLDYPCGRCYINKEGLYLPAEKVRASCGLGKKFYELCPSAFMKGNIQLDIKDKPVKIPYKFYAILKNDYPDDYIRLKQENLSRIKEIDEEMIKMTNDSKLAYYTKNQAIRTLDEEIDPLTDEEVDELEEFCEPEGGL